jgi:excisionase family DNA binding protein
VVSPLEGALKNVNGQPSPTRRVRRHPDAADDLPAAVRRWASLTETANYLGVSLRTVRTMITDGRLTAYRGLGKRVIRIDLNEVDAAMRPLSDKSSA